MGTNTSGDSEGFAAIKKIIEAISTNHDRLKIKSVSLREKAIICVECSECDYSRLVGAKGGNITALELIFRLMEYAENSKDGVIKVETPPSRKRAEYVPFQFNPAWGEKQLKSIMLPVCRLALGSGSVEVGPLTRDALLLKITARCFTGETYRSSEGEDDPVSFAQVKAAFLKVVKAVTKANGRDVELDMAILTLPDTSR